MTKEECDSIPHWNNGQEFVENQYNTNLRNNILEWTQEECLIYKALEAVEDMEPNIHLSMAVDFLAKARQAVATYIVEKEKKMNSSLD